MAQRNFWWSLYLGPAQGLSYAAIGLDCQGISHDALSSSLFPSVCTHSCLMHVTDFASSTESLCSLAAVPNYWSGANKDWLICSFKNSYQLFQYSFWAAVVVEEKSLYYIQCFKAVGFFFLVFYYYFLLNRCKHL